MTGIGYQSYSLYMARISLSICILFLLECHHKKSYGQTYTFISTGYKGCFYESVLQIRVDDWNNNTGNICKSRCQTKGYKLAGTKKGNQCFCGNVKYSDIEMNNCVEKCPGNKCEKCGGSESLSLFNTTGDDNCGKSKCQKGEFCKDDKNGFLCVSYKASQGMDCLYNGTTKTPTKTTAPTPIYAGNKVTTKHVHPVPASKTSTSTSSINSPSGSVAPTKAKASVTTPQSSTRLQKHTNISADLTFVENNDRQYFISNRNLSYWSAKENCKMLKAAIVSYTNPVLYILLQRNITLNGTYWVGDGVEQADDKCLVLETKGSTSLYSKPCTKPLYSICSRVANISDILNQPEFVELIKNMTVNSRKTFKMKRKLNCSHDNRKSAKAIGAIIGAGVISVICSLLLLSDLQNVIKGKFDHNKTN